MFMEGTLHRTAVYENKLIRLSVQNGRLALRHSYWQSYAAVSALPALTVILKKRLCLATNLVKGV